MDNTVRGIALILPRKVQYGYLLYFVWEDQSAAMCCIFHIVLISCITVQHSYVSNWASYTDNWENYTVRLGKCSTVMQRSAVK